MVFEMDMFRSRTLRNGIYFSLETAQQRWRANKKRLKKYLSLLTPHPRDFFLGLR